MQGYRGRCSALLSRVTRQLTVGQFPSSSAGQATNATLYVSELFRSIQGEGPFSGRPSVFLRLGMCNLNCIWCDTPYTWLFNEGRLSKVQSNVSTFSPNNVNVRLPSVYDKSIELLRRPVQSVVDDVLHLAGHATRNVVVTGGEPLLHKKPLLHVLPLLSDAGFHVEFETNGTISPTGLSSNVHLNVSPKLSNSLQPRRQRLNWKVLEECTAFNSFAFKFVIDCREDIDEVLEIVQALRLNPSSVFIMPQGQVSYSILTFLTTVPITTRITVTAKTECNSYTLKYASHLLIASTGPRGPERQGIVFSGRLSTTRLQLFTSIAYRAVGCQERGIR